MVKVLEYIKTFPHGKATCVHLSYDPKNEAARKLYQSFGFVETGQFTDDGEDAEVVAKLIL
jgi:diamine N-acetyltransferase